MGGSGVESYETAQYCGWDHNGYWLDNVGCFGGETLLTDCMHNELGSHDCGDQECIRISCIEQPSTPRTPPVYNFTYEEPVEVGILSQDHDGILTYTYLGE